jgi:hypothetical protein
MYVGHKYTHHCSHFSVVVEDGSKPGFDRDSMLLRLLLHKVFDVFLETFWRPWRSQSAAVVECGRE